ncbi:RNA-processing protein [Candidatus Woesearchaeota archaeon]|jgi:ribosomal RNA assembly protein|nr:RNA-processing protein [Candidatus Woesearchaeota archaeon]MBT4577084.1 RNA-processing protein [Candidatus Woesearchaeota archaeon]MBT5215736.1 RNA-processing protein [Candidatus Woesearchaeota archaeon]MBT6401836.1 RNA-processing protein [Candidatus Woesearchaeota archaeon]
MFSQELKIPQERVAILIGKKGQTKRLLERKTKTKLLISPEGSVLISSEENIHCFDALPIINAVGRGFNPEVALMLLDEKFSFELIQIKDFAKNDHDLIRLRSRTIGTNGKARMMLEKLTGVFVSVYGKTVALIGKVEDNELARRAVEKLLKGAPHGNVYKYIELQKREALM